MFNDIQAITTTLSNYITVISNRAFRWKKIFNFDLPKLVHHVTYSRKTKKLQQPTPFVQ